ncbi:MFS transporter [Lysobacter korlensis]|uniref:MFS transporter n=1 Tax=Lysobacter korlensis TaxID=553636 RepID=A0ABV6RU15_9GAMM
MTSTTDYDLAAVQRRVVRVLVAGQVLGGLGIGATLAIGAVLAAQLAGTEAWAGAAATMSTLGAAAASIPLARLAARAGRRTALTTGVLTSAAGCVVTVAAAGIPSFPLLLLGFALLGAGVSVNLQARFAATDIASAERRGRDLSIVVWSTTVGAVVGPNLFGPGEVIAEALGMPELTGSFVIAVAAQLAAVAVYLVGLRPDPYLVSRTLPPAPQAPAATSEVRAHRLVILAIGTIGASHAVMVSVMSMTPVHLVNHGATLTIVGLTISLHVAGMFAVSPVFGWLSDKIGAISTILIGQATFVLALVCVALGADDTTLVTVGLILLGLGWSASTVAGSALVAQVVTGSARTRVQGRTDLVMNISGAGGGALAGPVLALIGYSGLAWVALVLVAAVVAAVLVVTRTRTPEPAPAA